MGMLFKSSLVSMNSNSIKLNNLVIMRLIMKYRLYLKILR